MPAGIAQTAKSSDCKFSGTVPAATAVHIVVVNTLMGRSSQGAADAAAGLTTIQVPLPAVSLF